MNYKNSTLYIEPFRIQVVRKKVKNINLSVKKDGQIVVSMPYRGKLAEVEAFVKSKIDWVQKTLQKTQAIKPTKTPQLIDGEQHFIWGVAYMLNIIHADKVSVEKTENQHIVMCIPDHATAAQRQKLLDYFYAQLVDLSIFVQLGVLCKKMRVPLPKVSVRKMATRWGSCTPAKKSIRINSELAKYPPKCLQYVLVHELAHFFVKGHGDDFIAIIDKNMPDWQKYKEMLDNHAFQAA